MTQEYVNSIWEIEQYAHPCVVHDEYLSNFTPWEIQESFFGLVKDYVGGSISAYDFADALNELNNDN